jgi:hypothetical protein
MFLSGIVNLGASPSAKAKFQHGIHAIPVSNTVIGFITAQNTDFLARYAMTLEFRLYHELWAMAMIDDVQGANSNLQYNVITHYSAVRMQT